jgi:transposase
MAKAYSLDLRERVFGAWQRGEGSQARIAVRFGVSERFVRGVVRRQRESGGVAAKAHGGGRVALASPEKLACLKTQVALHNDHTVARASPESAGGGLPAERSHGGPLAFGAGSDAKKRRSKMMKLTANG